MKIKRGLKRILAIFQGTPMFSHINEKLSMRNFEIAEHRSILKKKKKTSSHPKQVSTPQNRYFVVYYVLGVGLMNLCSS